MKWHPCPLAHALILTACLPALARGDVFGLKSNGGLFAGGNRQCRLFSFSESGGSFVDIGPVRDGGLNILGGIDVMQGDALAISTTWGLLGYRIDLSYTPGNEFFTVTGSTLMSINPSTAVGTLIGSSLVGREIRGATFDLDGALWVIDSANNEVLQINPADGTIVGSPAPLTFNGNPNIIIAGVPTTVPTTLNGNISPPLRGITDIAVRCDGTLIVVGFTDDPPGSVTTLFFKVDVHTGALTLVGMSRNDTITPGITFSKDAADPDDLFATDSQGADDIFQYDTHACFERTTLFEDFIPTFLPVPEDPSIVFGFPAGYSDLAALMAPAAVCPATNLCNDCNGNSVPDCLDVGSNQSPNCNANSTADCIDIEMGVSEDCNHNGIPDTCDIASGFSQDCNHNGIPDSCDIAGGASLDCNHNGIPDTCDIASGYSQDCNHNNVPDSCDIASSSVPDCDGNGVPDVCDLASGAGADCNNNGVPDSCDIATLHSFDANHNGVPDECEDPAQLAQGLCHEIATLDIALFVGHNNHVRAERRHSLSVRACQAAERIVHGHNHAAIALLRDILEKIDGQSPPPDWMIPSAQKTALAAEVAHLIALLH